MVGEEFPRCSRMRHLLIRQLKVINRKLTMETQNSEKSFGWGISSGVTNKYKT